MRYNDSSYDCAKWTNAKLMREAREAANLESFANMPGEKRPATPDNIREITRIYRTSWLNPILDEIERRFVKVRA